jgi:hypothetical protein
MHSRPPADWQKSRASWKDTAPLQVPLISLPPQTSWSPHGDVHPSASHDLEEQAWRFVGNGLGTPLGTGDGSRDGFGEGGWLGSAVGKKVGECVG